MKPTTTQKTTDLVSQIIINGDLAKLSQEQKVQYYNGYCERLGLDPFTKPFDLLRLNGREVLYCTRSGAQQLNKLHQVSHIITSRELIAEAGVYQVTARASLPDNRCSESIGAVNIAGLKGDAYANAIMKAETKAKRRATLDLLGLGVLDESEAETIKDAQPVNIIQEPLKPSKEVQEVIDALPELEATVTEYDRFSEVYPTIGQLQIAATKATTVEELMRLYKTNKRMVDTNQIVKDTFSKVKSKINGTVNA